MSLIGNSGRQSWSDFLNAEDDRDMTIEKAHDLARRYLEQEGLDPDAYTVAAAANDRGRDGQIKLSIFPRPMLPSFGAEWDNNWNRS